MSFWHLASVSIPDNSRRDQGPLNQLCEPESVSAATGITLQKAGRGTHVTTDSVFACSLLHTLYQIRGRLLSEQGCTVVKGQCLLLSYLTWEFKSTRKQAEESDNEAFICCIQERVGGQGGM